MKISKMTAPQGEWLTQAREDIQEHERSYVKEVAGFGDLQSLWRTATQAEKDAHDKAVEEEQRREAQSSGLD